ncbi:PorV/PorQ family protein, partial [bacterium]|nr:PorV/PorQ family protein [bacterium]
AFDRVGIGARPKGMGDAFTAISDDGNSIYWNPAGIARIEGSQLSVMHKDLFGLGLINYEFLGYVHPNIGNGSLGFSWIRLDTTRNVEFMDYSENIYIISYGMRIAIPFSLGANIKYYSVDYREGGSGLGADIGVLYNTFAGHLNLGLLYQDFNRPKIRWETQAKDELPANLRLGIGFRPNAFLNLALDLDKLLESYVESHLGIEWWLLNQTIGLRTGLINQDKGKWNFTLGGSLGYRFFRFDYAWERHYDLGGTHLFSLVITF